MTQPSRLCSTSQTQAGRLCHTSHASRPFHGLDKTSEIAKTARNLPHWTQPGCTYFVTFRLADALPQAKLRALREEKERWLAIHPEPWDRTTWEEYDRLFPERVHAWLDAGYGTCLLRRPELRGIVAGALRHFDGERYALEAFAVMPNHVHALVSPESGTAVPAVACSQHSRDGCATLSGEQAGRLFHTPALPSILHSWKSFSAHAIRKRIGGSGPLWMDENFDHAVRSPEHLRHYREYIAENPAKAGLGAEDATVWLREEVAG